MVLAAPQPDRVDGCGAWQLLWGQANEYSFPPFQQVVFALQQSARCGSRSAGLLLRSLLRFHFIGPAFVSRVSRKIRFFFFYPELSCYQ